jgi:hypothetical protein
MDISNATEIADQIMEERGYVDYIIQVPDPENLVQ